MAPMWGDSAPRGVGLRARTWRRVQVGDKRLGKILMATSRPSLRRGRDRPRPCRRHRGRRRSSYGPSRNLLSARHCRCGSLTLIPNRYSLRLLLAHNAAFITHVTRSSSVMSRSGSPATAIRSANLPASIVPIRSLQPMISAAVFVADRMASDRRLTETAAIPELSSVLAVRDDGGVGREADRQARF